jgi:hypothetical protein
MRILRGYHVNGWVLAFPPRLHHKRPRGAALHGAAGRAETRPAHTAEFTTRVGLGYARRGARAGADTRHIRRHEERSMAAKQQRNLYYRVTFSSEEELYQVCAREVSTSDLLGLIEIGDFIFPENKLVYNPGEERIKREFEGIRRTWIPYHAIVRIDEISDSRESEV